jgi:hypothetical protein
MTSRDKSPDPAADTPGRPPGAGDTTQSRGDTLPDPKLPHERDESASHQGTVPRQRIEQGRKDIENGIADTDKKAPMDGVYERQKQGG